MTTKQPSRTLEFFEQDEGFIKQLAKDIGCHYSKANERTFNLKKYRSDIKGKMGVFAWVHKEDNKYFWVATRKIWVEEAKSKLLTGRRKLGINCFPKDIQHADDSVCFNTKDDYINTVRVLGFINKSR